jgi:hypothetical protein
MQRYPKSVLQSSRLLLPKGANNVHGKKREGQGSQAEQKQAGCQDEILQASVGAASALGHFWKILQRKLYRGQADGRIHRKVEVQEHG